MSCRTAKEKARKKRRGKKKFRSAMWGETTKKDKKKIKKMI